MLVEGTRKQEFRLSQIPSADRLRVSIGYGEDVICQLFTSIMRINLNKSGTTYHELLMKEYKEKRSRLKPM